MFKRLKPDLSFSVSLNNIVRLFANMTYFILSILQKVSISPKNSLEWESQRYCHHGLLQRSYILCHSLSLLSPVVSKSKENALVLSHVSSDAITGIAVGVFLISPLKSLSQRLFGVLFRISFVISLPLSVICHCNTTLVRASLILFHALFINNLLIFIIS